MLRFFVSVMMVISSFSGLAEEEKCVDEQVKVVTAGEAKITRTKFCYISGTANVYSRSCRKKKCQAYKYPRRYYISEFLGPYGTPGFKLCREIGGTPEIFEFFAENEWHRSDRCLFSDGFVDTDTLLEFYIDRE